MQTDLLEVIRAVRATGRSREVACPAHDDRKPSLGVTLSTRDPGRVLLYCQAGCTLDAVLAAAGLSLDVIAPTNGKRPATDLDILYDYIDEQGTLLFQVVRKPGKDFKQRRPDPDSPGEWLWKLDDTRRVLYRLPQVLAAVQEGREVWVVEGEKDVAACEAQGLIATCNPGGAASDGSKTKWRKEYSEALKGADVVIVADKDPAGRAHATYITRSLASVGVQSWRVVEAARDKDKDAADHFAAGLRVEDFVETKSSTPPRKPDDQLPELDEFGQAWVTRRFAREQGEDLRYVAETGAWYIWDGQRFALDKRERVRELLRASVGQILVEAAAEPRQARVAALAKCATKYSEAGGMSAILANVRSYPSIAREDEAFDRDPFLFNLGAGTLDLRTQRMRPVARSDEITQLASPELIYDPDAVSERWDEFLTRVFDGNADLMRYVQTCVGYSLTGDTSEECMFVLYGSGRNGKSTFIRVLRRLLGDYHGTANSSTILDGGNTKGNEHRQDLVSLRGKRFVSAIEANEGKRLNEALIKTMTGRDALSLRAAFGHTQLTVMPTYKLWLAVNALPVVRDATEGLWSRMRVIPFSVMIPKAERDPYYDDKLWEEHAGIFRWAVEGCRLWQESRLGEPAAVIDATQEYRDESDDMAAFIGEACVLSPNARSYLQQLYAAWQAWSRTAGVTLPMSRKALGLWLDRQGCSRYGLVKVNQKPRGYWFGIAPKQPVAEEAEREGLGL